MFILWCIVACLVFLCVVVWAIKMLTAPPPVQTAVFRMDHQGDLTPLDSKAAKLDVRLIDEAVGVKLRADAAKKQSSNDQASDPSISSS